jgi:hypothetical protein
VAQGAISIRSSSRSLVQDVLKLKAITCSSLPSNSFCAGRLVLVYRLSVRLVYVDLETGRNVCPSIVRTYPLLV